MVTVLCLSVPFVIVFNWNHFEIRLLNVRINFFFYCGLFVLVLVVERDQIFV